MGIYGIGSGDLLLFKGSTIDRLRGHKQEVELSPIGAWVSPYKQLSGTWIGTSHIIRPCKLIKEVAWSCKSQETLSLSPVRV